MRGLRRFVRRMRYSRHMKRYALPPSSMMGHIVIYIYVFFNYVITTTVPRNLPLSPKQLYPIPTLILIPKTLPLPLSHRPPPHSTRNSPNRHHPSRRLPTQRYPHSIPQTSLSLKRCRTIIYQMTRLRLVRPFLRYQGLWALIVGIGLCRNGRGRLDGVCLLISLFFLYEVVVWLCDCIC